MGLLDKLFRRPARPMSQLDDFLSMIERDAIPARARESKDPELRVPTAVCLLVLEQSGRFTRELFAALKGAPIPLSASIQSPTGFDAVAFETAAFIHYSLLAPYLLAPDDLSDDHGDWDDGADEEDPYFAAMRTAHHLTAAMLSSMVSFTVDDKVFANRPIAYAIRAPRQASVEMFEGVLLEAVETGRAATLRSTGISSSASLPVIVGLNARTFAITMLPALEKVARSVVDHASELGLH